MSSSTLRKLSSDLGYVWEWRSMSKAVGYRVKGCPMIARRGRLRNANEDGGSGRNDCVLMYKCPHPVIPAKAGIQRV